MSDRVNFEELQVGDTYVIDDITYQVVDVIENDGQKSIVSISENE